MSHAVHNRLLQVILWGGIFGGAPAPAPDIAVSCHAAANCTETLSRRMVSDGIQYLQDEMGAENSRLQSVR